MGPFSSFQFIFIWDFMLDVKIHNIDVSLRQSSLGSEFEIHGFIFPNK